MIEVRPELMELSGETDGTNTAGDFSLDSDILSEKVTVIVLPKGSKARIWFREVSGAPVTVSLQFTKDSTATTPSFKPLSTVTLPSEGYLSVESRRPIVIKSVTGKEGFKFSWSQSTAGKSYISAIVEIDAIEV